MKSTPHSPPQQREHFCPQTVGGHGHAALGHPTPPFLQVTVLQVQIQNFKTQHEESILGQKFNTHIMIIWPLPPHDSLLLFMNLEVRGWQRADSIFLSDDGSRSASVHTGSNGSLFPSSLNSMLFTCFYYSYTELVKLNHSLRRGEKKPKKKIKSLESSNYFCHNILNHLLRVPTGTFL